MGLDLYGLILEKIAGKGFTDLTLSGMGEPFLHPELDTMVSQAVAEGYKVHLLTNGTQPISDAIMEMIEDLRISVHYLDIPGWIRTTKAKFWEFKLMRRSVNYLYKNHPGKVILTGVRIPGDEDFEDLETIKGAARKEGKIKAIEKWLPHNWVDTFNYRRVPCTKVSCGRPFNGPLQVQVDGTVNQCCFDYDGKLLLGDLKTQGLEEIFDGEVATRLRLNHTTGDHKGYICDRCDQRMNYNGLIYSSYDVEDREGRTSTTLEEIAP